MEKNALLGWRNSISKYKKYIPNMKTDSYNVDLFVNFLSKTNI